MLHPVQTVFISRLRFERYCIVARWWEKYLSKRNPLKHTCSWHDKLTVLWILNRQVKISLCISFHYTRKRDSKVREGILNLKKIASCKKSRKLLHTLQKANMRAFYARQKSVYFSLTCGKQSNLSKGTCLETPGFCKPFIRNCRYSLQASLTVLSKLMQIISKKLSNYWQIPGNLLHFIPIIIDIIIFR